MSNQEYTKQHQGTYFTRYVPEKKSLSKIIEEKQSNKTIITNIDSVLSRVKFVMGILLIFLFSIGIVVSMYMGWSRSSKSSLILPTNKAVNSQSLQNMEPKKPNYAPLLTNELSAINAYGLVLVSNKALSTEPLLNTLKEQTKQEWMDFATKNKLKTTNCTWDKLEQCQQRRKHWVFVILPDFWKLAALDKLLASGASVLLYDAPFQVASTYTTGEFSLYGLQFKQEIAVNESQNKNQFALLDNRELSLGFEVGSVLTIERRSAFYKASSGYPQALASDTSITRLYAKSIGKGRLVWMDFSPNNAEKNDKNKVINREAVLASLFRYFNERRGTF